MQYLNKIISNQSTHDSIIIHIRPFPIPISNNFYKLSIYTTRTCIEWSYNKWPPYVIAKCHMHQNLQIWWMRPLSPLTLAAMVVHARPFSLSPLLSSLFLDSFSSLPHSAPSLPMLVAMAARARLTLSLFFSYPPFLDFPSLPSHPTHDTVVANHTLFSPLLASFFYSPFLSFFFHL